MHFISQHFILVWSFDVIHDAIMESTLLDSKLVRNKEKSKNKCLQSHLLKRKNEIHELNVRLECNLTKKKFLQQKVFLKKAHRRHQSERIWWIFSKQNEGQRHVCLLNYINNQCLQLILFEFVLISKQRSSIKKERKKEKAQKFISYFFRLITRPYFFLSSRVRNHWWCGLPSKQEKMNLLLKKRIGASHYIFSPKHFVVLLWVNVISSSSYPCQFVYRSRINFIRKYFVLVKNLCMT